MVNQKFSWDGEKIKTTYEDEKFTPKDMLNGLAGAKSQLNQMNSQKDKIKEQLAMIDNQILSVSKHIEKLQPFEDKCIEIQKEKLLSIIKGIESECVKKAVKSSNKTIAKDPSAYTDSQKKQLPYLDYQKLLATNEKVAEKISSQIISKYLFETPIFDNPFKD